MLLRISNMVFEPLVLFWVNLSLTVKKSLEFFKLIPLYKKNPNLIKVDLLFLRSYLFNSPYTVSKQYLKKRGVKDIHQYGETWASCAKTLVKELNLNSKDLVYELGSGSGRFSFWMSFLGECRVVGIEMIDEFVQIGNAISERLNLENVNFISKLIEKSSYRDATCIYFYGTSFADETIKKLIKKFEKLKKGTKILTVSFSILDYSNDTSYEISKVFTLPYPWGKANCYLHEKSS